MQTHYPDLTHKKIADVTKFTALLLFITALTQDAYYASDGYGSFLTLLAGWLGLLMESGHLLSVFIKFVQGKGIVIDNQVGATFTWLANPAIFLALIAISRNVKAAFQLSLVSTILILSFLAFGEVLANEAGGYARIRGYKAGYWLWLASSLTLLAGAGVLVTKGKEQQELNSL
jgi:glycerol-3-phosphate acyltransferase PlsY